MNKYKNITYLLLLIGILASCSSPKKVIYFNEVKPNDSIVTTQNVSPRPEIIVQPDDILAINVSSITSFTDKNTVEIFNNGGVPTMATPQVGMVQNNAGGVKGFLVDKDGNIDYPIIGKIKVGGLNFNAVNQALTNKLKDYVKDPVVEVRIINYKISLLGEVNRIGTVVAPNQTMNILEALTAAGDIPITGRKDNVLVIRENNGKKEFGRLNLNNKNIFTSPFYYLKQNDIVYVEPNRIRRQESNEFLRFYLPAILSLLTTALTIYGFTSVMNR